jgi:predicted negative regulator of RcsB-dependent stress response
MVADHIQDEEQVEALKRWWDENGRSTLIAVGLAVAGTVGWQQYQQWDANQAAAASDQYAEVLRMREAGENGAVLRELVEGLKQNHSGSTYAAFAALQLAADAVGREAWDEAEAQLRWVLTQGAGERIDALAQLRLARVLAAGGDESGALAILESGNAVYPVAFAMALGDIHLAAGRESEALTAYRDAESAALLLGNVPAMLETKIDALASRQGGDDTQGATS